MKVVLDTNVLMSGLFFGGLPGRILEAWRDGRIALVMLPPILLEYRRVAEALRDRYEEIDAERFLRIVAVHGEIVEAPELEEPVTDDPEDDKFLACALAAGASTVVSGDRDLRAVSGWRGIAVLTPRQFAHRHLSDTDAPGG